jgi:hypothetical protein
MNSPQTKNRMLISLQSLFFVVTLLIVNITFAAEKTPLTRAERTDLNYDDNFLNYPSIKILEEQPAGMRYGNCHNYAISKTLGLKGHIPETFPIMGQQDWHDTLEFTKKYCKEVSIPQKGDLVTYHDPKSMFPQEVLHTGLVYDDGIVEDKWGASTQVFTHPTFDLPAFYGNNIKYHRIIKPTDEIIEDIKTTIPQCDYKTECTDWNNILVNHAEQSDNDAMWQAWQRIMCLDVEASNADGQSLVMIGAKNNNPALVHVAIQHKANRNKKDKNGKTALHLAKDNGHSSMVALLKQHKPSQKKPFLYSTLKQMAKPSKTAEENFWQNSHS